MAKFRKKPVIIEAVQLEKLDGLHIKNVLHFLGERVDTVHSMAMDRFEDYVNMVNGSGGIVINTLEGKMLAAEGDWIIKGVNGEFYPCKPDIFDKTYERAV